MVCWFAVKRFRVVLGWIGLRIRSFVALRFLGLLVWFFALRWVCGLLCLVLCWLIGSVFGFLEICSLVRGKGFGVMVYLVG